MEVVMVMVGNRGELDGHGLGLARTSESSMASLPQDTRHADEPVKEYLDHDW